MIRSFMDLNPTREQRHRQRAYYLANVTMIDEKVGQIIDALDRQRISRQFDRDLHQRSWRLPDDHGHSQKWTMYEQITRVPMIIWAPGRFGEPRTIDALVQQMDLGPTILDWAGIPVPQDWEAQSLSAALEPRVGNHESSFRGRPFVYCEQVKDAVLTGCEFMTMVRSRRTNWSIFWTNPMDSYSIWWPIRTKSSTCGMTPPRPLRKSVCSPNYANGGFVVVSRQKTGAVIGVNNRCSKTYDVVSSRLPAGDPVTDRIRQARIGFGRPGSDSAGTDRIRQARHNPSHRLIDSRCQRPRSLSSPLKMNPSQ